LCVNPIAKFAIAQLHFFAAVIKDIKRLRRLGEKRQINEGGVACENSATTFKADIEKNVSRCRQHSVSSEPESPEGDPFKQAGAASI
jgi:hypothetical protein